MKNSGNGINQYFIFLAIRSTTPSLPQMANAAFGHTIFFAQSQTHTSNLFSSVSVDGLASWLQRSHTIDNFSVFDSRPVKAKDWYCTDLFTTIQCLKLCPSIINYVNHFTQSVVKSCTFQLCTLLITLYTNKLQCFILYFIVHCL